MPKSDFINCEKEYEEIAQKVLNIFEKACEEDGWENINVDIDEDDFNKNLIIKVYRMYDWYPIPFNYNISEELVKVFGTRDFDVNDFSRDGCETCDYGSKYGHEFRINKKYLI